MFLSCFIVIVLSEVLLKDGIVGEGNKNTPVPTAYCWDRSHNSKIIRHLRYHPACRFLLETDHLCTYLKKIRFAMITGAKFPSIATRAVPCADALSFALISPFAKEYITAFHQPPLSENAINLSYYSYSQVFLLW